MDAHCRLDILALLVSQLCHNFKLFRLYSSSKCLCTYTTAAFVEPSVCYLYLSLSSRWLARTARRHHALDRTRSPQDSRSGRRSARSALRAAGTERPCGAPRSAVAFRVCVCVHSGEERVEWHLGAEGGTPWEALGDSTGDLLDVQQDR